jgi:hypothetical protein
MSRTSLHKAAVFEPFCSVFLYLSRACLGKRSFLNRKSLHRKNDCVFTHPRAGSFRCRGRRPIAALTFQRQSSRGPGPDASSRCRPPSLQGTSRCCPSPSAPRRPASRGSKPCIKRTFRFESPLCLSRACLGKPTVSRSHKKGVLSILCFAPVWQRIEVGCAAVAAPSQQRHHSLVEAADDRGRVWRAEKTTRKVCGAVAKRREKVRQG